MTPEHTPAVSPGLHYNSAPFSSLGGAPHLPRSEHCITYLEYHNRPLLTDGDNINQITISTDYDPTENLTVDHRHCPEACLIIDFLENGSLPADNNLAQKIILSADHYFIHQTDKILRHIRQPRSKVKALPQSTIVAIFAPTLSRNSILSSCHNLAHVGITKLFEIIQERFYWPNL